MSSRLNSTPEFSWLRINSINSSLVIMVWYLPGRIIPGRRSWSSAPNRANRKAAGHPVRRLPAIPPPARARSKRRLLSSAARCDDDRPVGKGAVMAVSDARASGFGKMVTVEDLIGPLDELERKRAPKRLWIGGDASIFKSGTLVSVVGSRSPSPAGIRRTRRLARELVRRDMVVVSGLARGIDTVAHETAMDCGGRTVAVLATPLDQATPPGNSRLQQRIIRDHAAVTQFPEGTPILKMNFALRNRTMALLSAATVIVEAGPNSGNSIPGLGSAPARPPVVHTGVRGRAQEGRGRDPRR